MLKRIWHDDFSLLMVELGNIKEWRVSPALRTMENSKTMYPYGCIYQNNRRIFIWISDEKDEKFKDVFMTNSVGNLISPKNKIELKKLLGNDFKKVKWEDYHVMNFDRFWNVLADIKANKLIPVKSCIIVNNGWNFIEDMLWTLYRNKDKHKLRTPLLDKVYSKFFYGLNLPSITPDGRHYAALFTNVEIISLRENMKEVWSGLLSDPRFWKNEK